MKNASTQLRDFKWTLLGMGLLVLFFDVLFYKKGLGINLGIINVLLVITVHVFYPAILRDRIGVLLSILIFGLSISTFLHIKFFTVLFSIIGITMLLIIGKSGWTDNLVIWLKHYSEIIRNLFSQIIKDTKLYRFLRGSQKNTRSLNRVKKIAEWIIALGISIIFISLFSAANPIINKYVSLSLQKIDEILKAFFKNISFFRILFWIITAGLLWSLFRIKLSAKHLEKPSEPVKTKNISVIPDSFISKSLIVFNAIFLVETILDIIYLWGGVSLPQGMSYAEYAHRGAYPLIAVAILSAIFVLVTFNNNKKNNPGINIFLVILWLIQNIFLTFSSFWRLHLYIKVYYLTLFRVNTIIWLILVTLALIWICIKIVNKYSNKWLISINLISLISILYISIFFNLSSLVAWYNVKHCKEITKFGVQLDVEYLDKLGSPAIDALIWISNRLDDNSDTALNIEVVLKKIKQNEIKEEIKWQEWNLHKKNIKQKLEHIEF